MKLKFSLIFALAMCTATLRGGNVQRVGHTTLVPRHSNPDDGGLYNSFIDPTNGYAYFLGNYLFKLDITGNLPVQVGPALNAGSSSYAAIDPAAGYVYITRNTILNRFALGSGTNPVTSAGSLTLAASSSVGAVIVDDSDPDPAKHYGYVFCHVTGAPARIAKIALSTFTELGYSTLNAGETNLGSALIDTANGYAYFATTAAGSAEIIKIKLMPGTNNAVRVGAVNIGVPTEGIGLGSLDTLHGYAYYGTYGSALLPSRIYKMKLGAGNAAPTMVGSIDLHEGQARLSLSVLDSVNGFVYFSNDNTYPGGVHQFALNGTNLPVELGYLQFQGGPSNNLANGTSAFNTTTNDDGILPYGEVYFRSAVFDPIRGNAYFGQDSKPDQVVKVKVAQIDPISISAQTNLSGGGFQFSFSNIVGAQFSALAATNLTLPMSNWTTLGVGTTEVSPGYYKFIDPQATNYAQRFYRVRSP
jgi:hypothetical protein